MPTENRAYGLLRDIVEGLGGTMIYEREGYPPHGAWIITLNKKSAVIRAIGERTFKELDCLYEPKNQNPKTWDDYHHELVSNAEAQLLALHSRLTKDS